LKKGTLAQGAAHSQGEKIPFQKYSSYRAEKRFWKKKRKENRLKKNFVAQGGSEPRGEKRKDLKPPTQLW